MKMAKTAKKNPKNKSTAKNNQIEYVQAGKVSFDWQIYLRSDSKFKSAPIVAFGQHLNICKNWNKLINESLKVEVQNPDAALPSNISSAENCYWIAGLVKVEGYFILLRFEGYEDDDSDDFWMHILDPDLHEIGYSQANKKHLLPPRSIISKQSDWRNYLIKRITNSHTISIDFQAQVADSVKSKLKIGLQLEAFDINRVSSVRVANVVNTIGTRIKIEYLDSTAEADDRKSFWCDAQSTLIHPVGWANLVGHELTSSKEYSINSLKKIKTGQWDKEDASFDYFPHLFRQMKALDKINNENKFKEGMRIEAVDALDQKSICVSNVYKVLRYNYLMIGIDGNTEKDGSDSFCYHKSDCLPVEYCKKHKIPLTTPPDYSVKNFNYKTYLKHIGADPAPESLFDDSDIKPKLSFKKGMYLEAADYLEPNLICPAIVKQVAGRLIKIGFVGWNESYDQWLNYNSSEIYPVGWCKTAGYLLEQPRIEYNEHQVEKSRPSIGAKKSKKVNKILTQNTATKTKRSKPANKRKSVDNQSITTSPRSTRIRKTEFGSFFESNDESNDTIKMNENVTKKRRSSKSLVSDLYFNDSTNDTQFSNATGSDETIVLPLIDNYQQIKSIESSNFSMDQQPIMNSSPINEFSDEKSSTDAINVSMDQQQTSISSLINEFSDEKLTTEEPINLSMDQLQTSISPIINEFSDEKLTADDPINVPNSQATSTSSGSQVKTPKTDDPNDWSAKQVRNWLIKNDFDDYADVFFENKFDGKRLLACTNEDICDLCSGKLGPAVKIYQEIDKLRKTLE